ncbi:MAG TPA: metal-dependent transcriptional regulator [Chitinophagaceae bacterium]|jgi:DtxR family Mn-dependent transcriptional regulator|nr:metal-dependent transcriptional regulator [Chitinophagaceae bacterium]
MQRSLADENYLKAVFHLSGDNAAPVTTGLLAEYLNVSAASVTDKMKRLKDKGYVQYQKSKGVLLSKDGRKIALSVIRKHRLWEQFLVEVLAFKWDEVHDIAEQLEHIDSDELIGRIDHYLGYPTADPHGDPIPDEKGKIDEPHLHHLGEVMVGTTVRIAAVANHDPEFLKFLDKKGLVLHREITLKTREAYDGTLTLLMAERKPVILSGQVARQIWVTQG